jgi:predicted MPP superfamily phosphohydrolase
MMSRRLLLGGLASGLAGLGISGALAHDARYVHPFRPLLERVELPLPAAHANLAGLRIGFVTDTHVGPYFSTDDLARATALLAAERPDLILLGGDFISESPRYAGPAAEVLGELAGAATLGGYAVLGNHDYSNSAAKMTAALTRGGVEVLRNQATRIATGRGDLWLAGIDESLLSLADPEATFAAIPPGSAALALWHEPEYADRTAALGAFAQLSGHSHGGQVRLPSIGALVVPEGGRRYVMGLNHAGPMAIYTSRGVGVFRPPVRLNCPPEVTLATLVARG